MHTKNLVMKHAFEALPSTVLSTPVGQQVYRVMVRNKGQQQVNRKGTKGGIGK